MTRPAKRNKSSNALAAGQMNYKQLRRLSPEAARQAVLEHLRANNWNISKTAMIFGITRAVVYDIIRRDEAGSLKDRSRTPKNQPRRTPQEIENRVIKLANQMRLSPSKLSSYIREHDGIRVPAGTIRNIIRRHRDNEELISIHLAD